MKPQLLSTIQIRPISDPLLSKESHVRFLITKTIVVYCSRRDHPVNPGGASASLILSTIGGYMVKSVSCLAVAFGLFMAAASTDLAAQEPSSDIDSYVNQLNKLADIIVGISTVEDVASAEPQATALFNSLAEILLETEDISTFLETLSNDENLAKVNERIETGVGTLMENAPDVATALQGMLERASTELMEVLSNLYMEDEGEIEVEQYEEGM